MMINAEQYKQKIRQEKVVENGRHISLEQHKDKQNHTCKRKKTKIIL